MLIYCLTGTFILTSTAWTGVFGIDMSIDNGVQTARDIFATLFFIKKREKEQCHSGNKNSMGSQGVNVNITSFKIFMIC